MSQPTGNQPHGEQRPESPPPGGPSYGQGSYGSYGQGGYGPSPSGYEAPSYSYGQPRRTNVLAIVSLVTSLIGIGIVGIITGHIARRQIRASDESGDGIALAGLIIGYIVTVVEVMFLFAVFGLLIVASTQSG
ncbi:MAG: DUF4190 domain-containing protein [Actinobacteria bacterium]|nr:DUF4190 domain-containing protein [Actinomycetota bacterium]